MHVELMRWLKKCTQLPVAIDGAQLAERLAARASKQLSHTYHAQQENEQNKLNGTQPKWQAGASANCGTSCHSNRPLSPSAGCGG